MTYIGRLGRATVLTGLGLFAACAPSTSKNCVTRYATFENQRTYIDGQKPDRAFIDVFGNEAVCDYANIIGHLYILSPDAVSIGIHPSGYLPDDSQPLPEDHPLQRDCRQTIRKFNAPVKLKHPNGYRLIDEGKLVCYFTDDGKLESGSSNTPEANCSFAGSINQQIAAKNSRLTVKAKCEKLRTSCEKAKLDYKETVEDLK